MTTRDPKLQGDLLEMCVLNGLRKILGKNCIDYPRKKIMYHDWSETKKNELHGNGFNLLTHPIEDIDQKDRENLEDVDVILYGAGWAYGEEDDTEINKLANGKDIWYLDSNDLYG